jgi:small-conductance mechanosensitive channel
MNEGVASWGRTQFDKASPLRYYLSMSYWKQLTQMITGDASRFNLTIRLGIALGFIVIQTLLIALTPVFVRLIKDRITVFGKKHIRSFTIRKLKILDTAQILEAIYFVLNVLKYALIILQLSISFPLVFSLFAPTQNLAATLFDYILTPIKAVFLHAISYIPNLITIAVFVIIAKYVIRSFKFFALRIERGKMVIPGFYPEWAIPTFNILRFVVYVFTTAVIYPYLPGSDSRAFQGISVFVGIIVSFGSSSAIGNLVAGIVLTYMRSFKIGDRIMIQNVTGFVMEKSLIVTRIRTHKNEYVTFPNTMVLSSSIVNYRTSTDDESALLLYAEITFNYATPWEVIHELLIAAALKTKYVLKNPQPFVLQTALDDFYAHYQINAYIHEVDYVPAIYSQLFQNIQTTFREAGLDMTAPHFRINLSESSRIPPADLLRNPELPAKKSRRNA